VALLLGFAVGLERELTNKYAGLRTNILVCVGACVFTIISIYGFPLIADGASGGAARDTARVAAQIVTGIGFIGGGTVLRHGANVYGLTTAATLWIAAAIGMACGAGMYKLAVFAALVTILVLVSVRLFEKQILPCSTKNTKRLKVTIVCLSAHANSIYDYFIEKYTHLQEISKKLHKNDAHLTKINVILNVQQKKPIQTMYKAFQNVEGVESIAIQEFVE
jgi:putative Mg2+ transporter-C (MgtC) family protein